MSDDFDDFVNKLQNQIYDETREEYGEIVFERWKNPKYCGAMENADGYGRVKGTCGDTMEIFLRFENEMVKDASFITDGCGTSGVCGSFAAELAHGKNPEEITDITGEYILSFVGDLPEKDRHCAFLASATLQEALDDYMKKMSKP